MMKARYLFVPVICLLVSGACLAGGEKHQAAVSKESRKIAKELKNSGWKVYGNALPLEAAITRYYQALADGEGSLYSMTAEAAAGNENQAIRKAQHQANAQYAAQREVHVSRDVNIQLSNTVSDEPRSEAEFDQTIQTKVDQHVKPLRPEVTLIRQKGDGKVEVKMLFLVTKE